MSPPRPESNYPLQQAHEVPRLAGARELSNAREVTRQLRAMDEDTKRVVDVDEEIVERRQGDRRPRWLASLMRGGGQ